MKIAVVGAGPVGCLAGIYAARRGHTVSVYELRDDLRKPASPTKSSASQKSINLALSERGVNAIRNANVEALLDSILSDTIPMHSRMVHGRDSRGNLTEEPQAYDVRGRAILAADRGGLNRTLLDQLASMPNVTLHFKHKLTNADFRKKTASFSADGVVVDISFDLLIGADGAHSATRNFLMKHTQLDFSQEFIDSFWCQFEIPAVQKSQSDESEFLIAENYLHVWPAGDCLFIAIPSSDKTFTCTLFLSKGIFHDLESSQDADQLLRFFDEKFPGVTPQMIEPESLKRQFRDNPHLPLISIRCKPYHFSSAAVILGDAAHAMVPFYGQGMNAGLEDVRILFETIDRHIPGHSPKTDEELAAALGEYTTNRHPDALAISQLAMQNYVEMRADVTSKIYLARKWIEEKLSVWAPTSGWKTQYSGVSFGNERYSEVQKRAGHQKKVLESLFGGLGVLGSVAVGVGVWRWRGMMHG